MHINVRVDGSMNIFKDLTQLLIIICAEEDEDWMVMIPPFRIKQRVETEQSVFEQGMNFYSKELFRLGELYI